MQPQKHSPRIASFPFRLPLHPTEVNLHQLCASFARGNVANVAAGSVLIEKNVLFYPLLHVQCFPAFNNTLRSQRSRAVYLLVVGVLFFCLLLATGYQASPSRVCEHNLPGVSIESFFFSYKVSSP